MQNLREMQFWFHESVSCLHDCMAMVLCYYAQDPVDVLGARWCFFHDPDAVTSEEFYYPSPTGDLGRDLAPFHDFRVRWRCSENADELISEVRSVLDDNRPVIVVEDNFFMPNRPAFHDVHAAHLVMITGYDGAEDTFEIMEPTPPLYRGPISKSHLLTAMGSDNESRPKSRDFFFAGAKLGLRWIEIEPFAPAPLPRGDRLEAILRKNIADFLAPDPASRTGLDGLEAYLRGSVQRIGNNPGDGGRTLAEIYTVGWAHMAQSALHSGFLKRLGLALQSPHLLESSRRVDSISAQWTAFRAFGAHGAYGRTGAAIAAAEIESRITSFLVAHRKAIASIDHAIEHLPRHSS